MDPAVLRDDMVASLEHESKQCVRSETLSIAMREVPRHEFIDDERGAYADRAFERFGTRVLAPSTVARLFELLQVESDDSVLVVGAGVGYTVALAAEIAGGRNVHAIDITRKLVYEARENLSAAGYEEVLVDCKDGAEGLPAYAPYDRILVEAAAVRPPRALLEQLSPEGQLVMPVGAQTQSLAVIERDGDTELHGGCIFAPLLVEGEQVGSVERNRTHREDREFARRNSARKRGWELDWIEWDD